MDSMTQVKLKRPELWMVHTAKQEIVFTRPEAEALHMLFPCPGGADCPCYQAGLEAKKEPL